MGDEILEVCAGHARKLQIEYLEVGVGIIDWRISGENRSEFTGYLEASQVWTKYKKNGKWQYPPHKLFILNNKIASIFIVVF